MLSTTLMKSLQSRMERRRFLRTAALGGAGAAAALAGAKPAHALSAAGANDVSDATLFNFALNFEYLGVQYYLAATGNAPLPGTLTGSSGGLLLPSGSTRVPFNSAATAGFALQLAIDELAHVTFFRAAITAEGGTPISQPLIDLNLSWSSMAVMAGLIPPGGTFNPFASEANFFVGAYVLEDVCITALAGASPLITDPQNLSYAASILGVEGYQVGLIRSFLSEIGGNIATNAISALRSTLSNAVTPTGMVNDIGTGVQGNAFNFTNVDYNGHAFRRTPAQVLAIAYGTSANGVTGGGFFPNGVNGSIRST